MMHFGRTNPVAFESPKTYHEALLDMVVEQIGQDLADGDASAIYDMLLSVPINVAEGFLPEEKLEKIHENWG